MTLTYRTPCPSPIRKCPPASSSILRDREEGAVGVVRDAVHHVVLNAAIEIRVGVRTDEPSDDRSRRTISVLELTEFAVCSIHPAEFRYRGDGAGIDPLDCDGFHACLAISPACRPMWSARIAWAACSPATRAMAPAESPLEKRSRPWRSCGRDQPATAKRARPCRPSGGFLGSRTDRLHAR